MRNWYVKRKSGEAIDALVALVTCVSIATILISPGCSRQVEQKTDAAAKSSAEIHYSREKGERLELIVTELQMKLDKLDKRVGHFPEDRVSEQVTNNVSPKSDE
mgnify:CR=1 FL=1